MREEKIMRTKIVLDYDDEADVLYLSFGDPVEVITEEVDNIGVRINAKTREIVGLTIVDFLAKFKSTHQPIKVSV